MNDYCVPDKNNAALLTISAQRDFLSPDSPVRNCGYKRIGPALAGLVEAFREAKRPIFHSVRLYRPDGKNVDACRRQAVEEGMRILMPGTQGAELLDTLKPRKDQRLDPAVLLAGGYQELAANEQVFYRPRWSAFFNTPLEQTLAEKKISTLVICGFSFSTGLRATVYDASERDFRIVVVSDAIGGASEEGTRELGRLGVYLMDTPSCIKWLSSVPKSSAVA